MTQSDRISDAARMVGDILKRVDQLIKAGNIDESIREIMHAKEIYPKHGYIRAYEERLAYLKEEHEKNIERERTRKAAEQAARVRDEQLRNQHEQERQRLEKEHEEGRKREEDHIKARQDGTHGAKMDQPEPHRTKETAADGLIGVSNTKREERLASDIAEQGSPTAILVVDDDEDMLQMISQALIFAGYKTTSLRTSDEAYMLLKKWTPKFILCDINLETSTMGGFSFYEKVRKLDHLHEVPFVFLTGLNDEVLLRTAKELGADDYLTKPISIDNLLATIKGKLKRFGTFRKGI